MPGLGGIFLLKKKSASAKALEKATAGMEDLFNRMRASKQIPVLDIRAHIMPVLFDLLHAGDLVECLAVLQREGHNESRHAVAVSLIAASIGKWMGLDRPALSRLTMAALLHDAGKVYVPPGLLEKRELDPSAFDLIKTHTVYGYKMINETVGLGRQHALVALQHHERLDGSGYPLGIDGSRHHARFVRPPAAGRPDRTFVLQPESPQRPGHRAGRPRLTAGCR